MHSTHLESRCSRTDRRSIHRISAGHQELTILYWSRRRCLPRLQSQLEKAQSCWVMKSVTYHRWIQCRYPSCFQSQDSGALQHRAVGWVQIERRQTAQAGHNERRTNVMRKIEITSTTFVLSRQSMQFTRKTPFCCDIMELLEIHRYLYAIWWDRHTPFMYKRRTLDFRRLFPSCRSASRCFHT